MQPVLAHIAGLPAEELIPLVYGPAGVWVAGRMLLTRMSVRRRARLERDPR
jgi:hypothetical protein